MSRLRRAPVLSALGAVLVVLVVVLVVVLTRGGDGSTDATGTDNSAGSRLRGVITSVSGDSLHVHTNDGRDVLVLITGTTQFGSSNRPATQAELRAGVRISVLGSPNAARRILVLGGGGSGRRSASPSPSADA